LDVTAGFGPWGLAPWMAGFFGGKEGKGELSYHRIFLIRHFLTYGSI